MTRNKSFVGCLAMDHVYVRDEAHAEVTIAGEPCRKLGTLKNGEQKTFQIGDGEEKIFLIADKVSKDYCNASMTVPAGAEDVAYAGKHHFSLGSNPFVFDGVELTPEEAVRQKKYKRKGSIIYILAIVAGLLIGGLATSGALNVGSNEPKEFRKGDFSITLTEQFQTAELDGVFTAYETKSVAVFAVREEASLFDDITLEEYAELVLLANDRVGLEVHEAENYVWISYADTPSDTEFYYFVALYKGKNAYWTVNFPTPQKNADKYRSAFMEWAESVDVGAPAVANDGLTST